MSQLEKLQKLAEQQNAKKTANLTAFSGLVCIHLGIPSKPYYPKLKDANGNKIKDEKGNDKRAEQPTGVQITLVQFGTGKKVIAVFPQGYKLDLLKAYVVGGKGYDIKSGNMYFLEQDCTLVAYD